MPIPFDAAIVGHGLAGAVLAATLEARGLRVRAYGERGANTIKPASATWTDIYNDWKNGTANVDIDARAVIVGLRDVYHPKYPAAVFGLGV